MGVMRRDSVPMKDVVEVPSTLFSRHASESSEETDAFLTTQLVELWTARLAASWPERRFVVETVSANETGDEGGLVFYTQRGASA
jgi:hypothetical protein